MSDGASGASVRDSPWDQGDGDFHLVRLEMDDLCDFKLIEEARSSHERAVCQRPRPYTFDHWTSLMACKVRSGGGIDALAHGADHF